MAVPRMGCLVLKRNRQITMLPCTVSSSQKSGVFKDTFKQHRLNCKLCVPTKIAVALLERNYKGNKKGKLYHLRWASLSVLPKGFTVIVELH